jgi:hypothetical protein
MYTKTVRMPRHPGPTVLAMPAIGIPIAGDLV